MRSLCLSRGGPVLLGWLLGLATATAQTIQTPPVTKTILDNGLTVLVREDHTTPVVTAQFWVRAGSITEGAWTGAGLSHVLEHMLFKGTTTRGIAQIAQQVEDQGGYINAYTSFDHTVFHINIPSDHWATAVDVLADCMMHATIPEEELLKEKQVILREMAMNQDDPDRRASLLLWATAFTRHPYRFPVIGYPDIYNRVTREDVVAYYHRQYVPNNIVFVVVGDIKTADVVAKLRDLTRDFRMDAVPPVYIPQEPPQLSPRERHEQMAVKLSRINLAWHIPAVTSPDVYALDVLAIILGQGRSSRLYRELLENRGLVHSIEASSYTPGQPGLFEIEATADPDKREPAIAAIRQEVQRLHTEPITDTEWRKAVKISVSSYISGLKTMEGQASDLANNEILVGDPNFSTVYLENLRKVVPQDIRRVAQTYLATNTVTITTLDPVGTLPPAPPAVPAGAGIKIQQFVLANGLRLLVREDPKLPTVDIRAVLKGGVIAETGANNGITKLTTRMLLKGTASRTADQIAAAIENVGGDISYFSGNNSFGVSAHALSEDQDLALDLVADVLQHPTLPEEMLARERQIQLAEIKSEQDQILPAAQQLLREAMFAQHPYRLNALGRPDSVAKLTRADLVAFQQRFVVPTNLVLAVFGNVNAAEVRRVVEAKFGGMKAVPCEFPKPAPETLARDVRKEETQPKEQAVLLLGYSGTDMFSPDRFALELIDEAYSGQGSQLFLRIRDELGLAYYVGAYELLGFDPGYFVFYVGTTAENVPTCEKELAAALTRLTADGLTPEELARARNSIIGQRKVRMQDNAELAFVVALDELDGLGYAFFQSMDARYRAVTMEDIKRVARKYFADKPHAVVVVKPANAPAESPKNK